MIEYDKKRQGNREAINAMKKVAPPVKGKGLPPVAASSAARRPPVERNTWMFIGNCFIQLPTNDVIDMLSAEQEHIEKDLEQTNKELKKNVEQLLLLEGLQEEFAGFNLDAVNK